ncbi:hypothetical protein BH23BAC2_BH23BAC2_27280 [soil metagenome]
MELKERIIQKIEKIDDNEALSQMERWLDALSEVGEKFSREKVNSVMERFSQYEKGILLNQKEVNDYFEEWSKGK